MHDLKSLLVKSILLLYKPSLEVNDTTWETKKESTEPFGCDERNWVTTEWHCTTLCVKNHNFIISFIQFIPIYPFHSYQLNQSSSPPIQELIPILLSYPFIDKPRHLYNLILFTLPSYIFHTVPTSFHSFWPNKR